MNNKKDIENLRIEIITLRELVKNLNNKIEYLKPFNNNSLNVISHELLNRLDVILFNLDLYLFDYLY